MNFRVRRWRPLARLLVLALIVAAVPLPCLAAPGDQPAARPGLRASVGPAVRAVASKTPASTGAERAQATPAKAPPSSPSFFRTGPGVAVIAILVGGTAYAIYSARHDRIHSTIPQGLQ